MTELQAPGYFKRVYPFVVVSRLAGYSIGGAVLVSIGVWDGGWGTALVSVFALRFLVVLSQLWRPAAIRLAGGVFDVLIPSVTGFVLGYEPSSMHLLVGGQVAAAFLVLQPKGARVVLAAGMLGIIAALLGEPYGGAVALTGTGVTIGQYVSITLGVLLTVGLVSMVGRTIWDTHRRLTELAEAEHRNAQLKQRFTSMVSHELRTPLTSIRGFADLLRTSRVDLADTDIAEFTATISDQAGHLSRLVDDILIVMKADYESLSVNIEPVDVAEVISSAVASVTLPEHVDLRTEVAAGLVSMADPDRLFQVTRNLLENAVKYGGPNIRIAAETSGDVAVISVSDDGAGIPADRVEDVFSEFVQLETHGAKAGSGIGLGLSIVRRLVEAMDGSIRYEAGQRPSFVVELPVGARPAELPVGC